MPQTLLPVYTPVVMSEAHTVVPHPNSPSSTHRFPYNLSIVPLIVLPHYYIVQYALK